MITAVAVRHSGRVFSLPRPNRHHHVLWMIADKFKLYYVDARGDDQGFLDDTGRYLTRREALAVATACGQLIRQELGSAGSKLGELYSEDLW